MNANYLQDLINHHARHHHGSEDVVITDQARAQLNRLQHSETALIELLGNMFGHVFGDHRWLQRPPADYMNPALDQLALLKEARLSARTVMLAWYICELNETGEDVLPLCREIGAEDFYLSGEDFLAWAQDLRRQWLATYFPTEAK